MTALKTKPPTLLAWSKRVYTTEGNDPLGLALRVGARLTNQLLFCITSITPRARYFSFLPWCIAEYRKREKARNIAPSLRESVRLREKAFVLGSVLNHKGSACRGGALTGSDKAIELFQRGLPTRAKLSKMNFSKNPAMSAYFGSLINIGLIKESEEMEIDPEIEEESEFTFDDIELSELGLRMAMLYAEAVKGIRATTKLTSAPDECSCEELSAWGRKGCLCQIRFPEAPDRAGLRDLFMNRCASPGDAHSLRKATLLLILHLAQQFGAVSFSFDGGTFNDATYFGSIIDWNETDEVNKITWPQQLDDIAVRWRMYHFHRFCSIGLETLFSYVVQKAQLASVSGTTFADLIEELSSRNVAKKVGLILGHDGPLNLMTMSPRELWARFGFTADPTTLEGATTWDGTVSIKHPLSERKLELALYDGLIGTAVGAVIASVMLFSSLLRFLKWKASAYGNWLAQAVQDDYLDLTTPLLVKRLGTKFGEFTNIPFRDLVEFLLRNCVVQQHETMSYTKSPDGTRAFFHTEQDRIYARTIADWRVGPVNGRLTSALQVLSDIGFLDEQDAMKDVYSVSRDGARCLATETPKLGNNDAQRYSRAL